MGCCFPKPSDGKIIRKDDYKSITIESSSAQNSSSSFGNVLQSNIGVTTPSTAEKSSCSNILHQNINVHSNIRVNESSNAIQNSNSSYRSNESRKTLSQNDKVDSSQYVPINKLRTELDKNNGKIYPLTKIVTQNSTINTVPASLMYQYRNAFNQNNVSTIITNTNTNLTSLPEIQKSKQNDKLAKPKIIRNSTSSHIPNQFHIAHIQNNRRISPSTNQSSFSVQNTFASHASNQIKENGASSLTSRKLNQSKHQNNHSRFISNTSSNLTSSPVVHEKKFGDGKRIILSKPVMQLLQLLFEDDFDNDHQKALLKLKKLETTIKLLSKDEPDYEMICKYVKNSQGPTHSFKVSIEHIYVGYRWGKLKDFKPLKKLGNRKLLWHGTQISNYISILSSGLLTLPPSNVSVTGKMFGNGIYFADVITKSAQYCKASTTDPYGLLILAQVALGDEYVLTKSEKIVNLPYGKNCVKGIGKYQHRENENIRTKYGVEVPCGTLELRHDINTSLRYNEYVVYNPEQILFEYLVLVKFDY
ncbi:uncharacterized protein LOC129607703 [Condylostylus longicornis]|uniref:uncharacterized protein LOC129607703 n=1 Tax=Condylostylus longicornis TaxID=2530218 RepID=UPI00244E1537|nr:uncharacterized protein LOC129607703 [Condylostylus longicornis]